MSSKFKVNINHYKLIQGQNQAIGSLQIIAL